MSNVSDAATQAPNAQRLAERVQQAMLARDVFSRWLGVDVIDIGPGTCTLSMTVRGEMLNGFGVAHGGIVFSVADSAFAFACNTHGRVTVSIENSITYPAAIREGDVLTAVAREEAASERLGYYRVDVTRQGGELVGLFRGTAYRTLKEHFPPAPNESAVPSPS
ncbi:MAG TPA: hydroxyphenylacetyl-CoA thioesterase PaaI [Gemmatimonadaceae bacterium]|nr:hydroxyphenylacetyl-CoA thioesterase PaaI [Gemmatimonadaceae bacterium]